MKITVRSKYPEVFNIFINTFVKLYPEEVENLHLFVDVGDLEDDQTDRRVQQYIKIRDHYYSLKNHIGGFNITLVSSYAMPDEFKCKGNNYVHMLWSSLQFEDVISFDDDIVWMQKGFFDYVKKTVPFNNVFGQKNIVANPDLESIASYVVGTRGVPITTDYFDSIRSKEVDLHQGNDTYKISKLHPNNTVYICNPKTMGTAFNSVITEYYYHLGALSTSLVDIIGKDNSNGEQQWQKH